MIILVWLIHYLPPSTVLISACPVDEQRGCHEIYITMLLFKIEVEHINIHSHAIWESELICAWSSNCFSCDLIKSGRLEREETQKYAGVRNHNTQQKKEQVTNFAVVYVSPLVWQMQGSCCICSIASHAKFDGPSVSQHFSALRLNNPVGRRKYSRYYICYARFYLARIFRSFKAIAMSVEKSSYSRQATKRRAIWSSQRDQATIFFR